MSVEELGREIVGCLLGRALRLALVVIFLILAILIGGLTGIPFPWSGILIGWIPLLAVGSFMFLKARERNTRKRLARVPRPLASTHSSTDETRPISAAFALYRMSEPLEEQDLVLSQLSHSAGTELPRTRVRKELSLLRVTITQLAIQFACRDNTHLSTVLSTAYVAVVTRLALMASDPSLSHLAESGREQGKFMDEVDAELTKLQASAPHEWERIVGGGPHLWTLDSLQDAGIAYVSAYKRGLEDVKRQLARGGDTPSRAQWLAVGATFAERLGAPNNRRILQIAAETAESVFAAPLSFLARVRIAT